MFPIGQYHFTAQKVLDLYSLRQQTIAANIANVNTPGFKAYVVPFPQQLADILDEQDQADEKLEKPPEPQAFAPDGEPMSNMERSFILSSHLFDRNWSRLGEDPFQAEIPKPPKGPELEAAILGVPLAVERTNGGFMRVDGNNVNIDNQTMNMFRNAMFYSGLAGDIGGSLKSAKEIIGGTY